MTAAWYCRCIDATSRGEDGPERRNAAVLHRCPDCGMERPAIPAPGWRVWKFEADDPGGYEMVNALGLEPFTVDDGWIYWRRRVSLGPTDEDLFAKDEDDRIEADRLRCYRRRSTQRCAGTESS